MAAQHIDLALQWPATNALKYGAFAQVRKRVTVKWHVKGCTRFISCGSSRGDPTFYHRRGFASCAPAHNARRPRGAKVSYRSSPQGLSYPLQSSSRQSPSGCFMSECARLDARIRAVAARDESGSVSVLEQTQEPSIARTRRPSWGICCFLSP
jgi:hypothetical protein